MSKLLNASEPFLTHEYNQCCVMSLGCLWLFSESSHRDSCRGYRYWRMKRWCSRTRPFFWCLWNPGALALVVIRLMDLPEKVRLEIGEKHGARYRAFSLEKVVDLWEALYEKLLQKGSA